MLFRSQVEGHIGDLCSKADAAEKKKVELIRQFFSEYKQELKEHLDDEENNVIPYILELEKTDPGRKDDELTAWIKENSIDIYARKHSNLEEKLYDLKNIIIKYLPPVADRIIATKLLFEIFRLERDLNDHARIEDKVMIPKVRMLEQKILGG